MRPLEHGISRCGAHVPSEHTGVTLICLCSCAFLILPLHSVFNSEVFLVRNAAEECVRSKGCPIAPPCPVAPQIGASQNSKLLLTAHQDSSQLGVRSINTLSLFPFSCSCWFIYIFSICSTGFTHFHGPYGAE
jgi:hypothetical protein